MARRRLLWNDPRHGDTLGDRAIKLRAVITEEYGFLAAEAGLKAGLTSPFVLSFDDYRARISRAASDGYAAAIENTWEYIDDRRSRGFSDTAIVNALLGVALPFLKESESFLDQGEPIDTPANPDGLKRF